MKCNYDCTYCAGHDNSQQHPDKELCEKMLSQAFRYVDAYMKIKKPRLRSVILNVYGGEAVYHPDIEYLLSKSSDLFSNFKSRWSLSRSLTTNASCKEKKWRNISEHLEHTMFSFHAQGSSKLKENYFRNLDFTHKSGKKYDAIVLMYPVKSYWQECLYTLKYMRKKKYNVRIRMLDGRDGVYTREQLLELKEMWPTDNKKLLDKIENKKIISEGRWCCGGRSFCVNRDFKNPVKFVEQEGYEGWHCSANQFFLMADSHTQSFYTNKDCHVRPDGTRGALATIESMDRYIDNLESTLAKNSNFFLKCVQKSCQCGRCAPKSTELSRLLDVMKIYNEKV